jgi:lipopolysaccharide assembly protein A
MRWICIMFLLLLVGAVGIFAAQNREPVPLEFLGRSVSWPPALLVVIAYLLGTVTGGTVTGMAWRSFRRAAAHPAP